LTSRWEDLAPSNGQRWMARHVRLAQAIFAVLALVMAGLGVSALASDDESGGFVPLLLVFVFLTNIWTWGSVARRVKRYDEEAAGGSES
jgi:K+ transporter